CCGARAIAVERRRTQAEIVAKHHVVDCIDYSVVIKISRQSLATPNVGNQTREEQPIAIGNAERKVQVLRIYGGVVARAERQDAPDIKGRRPQQVGFSQQEFVGGPSLFPAIASAISRVEPSDTAVLEAAPGG